MPGKTVIRPLIFHLFMVMPLSVSAQWAVGTETEVQGDQPARIAYTRNQDGYTLEIYRDAADTVRSRFIVKEGLLKLEEKSCPTYQIDNGMPNNGSIDGAPCLSNDKWAEYIFGRIQDESINSSVLMALMDGITLTFRFRLENGDYRETRFSLSGSKRSMASVIGEQVIVKSQ
jgi:hypothetical protein